jgi:predicted RNase H-like HicB family nuclease
MDHVRALRLQCTLSGGQFVNVPNLREAKKKPMNWTAIFRKVDEGYIGFVEELPGANTQGATLDEARANLKEAIDLVLEANRTLAEESLSGQDVIRETLVTPSA